MGDSPVEPVLSAEDLGQSVEERLRRREFLLRARLLVLKELLVDALTARVRAEAVEMTNGELVGLLESVSGVTRSLEEGQS